MILKHFYQKNYQQFMIMSNIINYLFLMKIIFQSNFNRHLIIISLIKSKNYSLENYLYYRRILIYNSQ